MIGKMTSQRSKRLRGIQSALPQIDLFVAAVGEVEDAAVLEEAADDGAHADAVADAVGRRAGGRRCRAR